MKSRDRVLANTETLQALAATVGEDELIEDIMSAGISYYTARDMVHGTYVKNLRETTQRCLYDELNRKHGVTRERLFTRVPARRNKAS